jgi:DNA-binding NtrC family response regulator
MTVYIAFGSAPIGKSLFLALFEQAKAVELLGHSRNADEAMAEIKRESPQLIIVEEILSLGWGMDVINSIEHRNGTPAVVMVSTMPPPRFPEEYRSQKIDLWLQLPQDYEELRSALRRLTKNDPVGAIAAWREKLAKEIADPADSSGERMGK